MGSHRRAEREREARPKAPKSSEKQITESLFDGEEYYTAAKTKMSALHRVKGRVLLSLCKTQAPDSRTAFVRWYVRTHRKFGKYAIQQLAVKNKISSQVALWRFKFLAQPFKQRRKNIQSFAGELASIIDNIERRSSENSIKFAFSRMFRDAIEAKNAGQNKIVGQFIDILDENLMMNMRDLREDTGLLNQEGIFKKMATQLMGKLIKAFGKLKLNKSFSELSDKGMSKKDKIRHMLHQWIGKEREYFFRWRINAAKMSLVLQGSNMNKDALNKRLSQMLLSSATGKMVLGMKLLKAHNDEVNKLFGNKADMCKKIINMVQSKTVIGLMGIALRKFRANVRECLQKQKILFALSKSATFQQSEMFQRLREHRLKCIFDEKINGSVRQRIINNLCKTQEHKMFELMRAAYIKMKAHNDLIKKHTSLLAKFIVNSAIGALTLGYQALKSNNAMEAAFDENKRLEEEKMRDREGDRDDIKKRNQLIKRLTNQGYNMQVMGVNAIREWLKSERNADEVARLEAERQAKEKDRILRRIMDSNCRFMGIGFRQALQWTVADREAEIARAKRMRGICNRMVDSNVRLMSAGYNKLLEEWKARQANLKEKLRFVIATLTDKDKQAIMMGYNQLKQRKLMLEGVGFGDDVAQKLKIRLIRKLTDTAYNLQTMGINCIKEWLASERHDEEMARLEAERQAKEKDRILRRIMDSNLRWAGIALRQAHQFMESEREKEIALIAKQRGIM